MNINRHNYETWVIDYFDGKLDPVQTAELMYFLSQNPDLEYEFNVYENLKVQADNLQFGDKEGLKKSFTDIPAVTDDNFEEFCIAETEGDLDEKSRARLFQYLEKNPHKNRELELYKKTKLTADESIVFPGLNKLKKYRLVPLITIKRISYAGVAAAVLIIVFLTFLFRSTPESELITTVKPDSDIPVKPDNEINLSAEANVTSEKTAVISETTGGESTQTRKIIPVVTEDSQPVTMSHILISGQTIKPIEIRKLENVYLASDITMLKNERPLQYSTRPPVQRDMTLAEFIRKKLQATELVRSAENLNVWSFAQAGIKGINYLTESDIEMHRKLNINGKTSAISIDSESFGFSAPLKK